MKVIKPTLVTIVLIILLSSPLTTLAQSPVTVKVDRTTLPRNEQLTLTLIVSGNALVSSPDLSGLEDFFVVGSSTSTQISIVNGRTTAQVIFVYRLQPLKEGNLVVGPISIEVGGQTHRTGPLGIEVLPATGPVAPPAPNAPPTGSSSSSADQSFFVEAEVDNLRPYLGQQITYTFRLYQAARFRLRPDYQPPAFTDFWSQDLRNPPENLTTVDGREYIVTEARTALFPANLGAIAIDPATIRIRGGIFGSDTILETEPLAVEVRSLPRGAPPDFSGAVGQFDISAQLSEATGRVNETLTLQVEIAGAGNIDALTEPALPGLPNSPVIASQATTKIDTEGEVVAGSRQYEWLIVPGQPGDYIFPSISFSYFDPDDETYRTVSTEPLPITIQPGQETSSSIALGGADSQTVDFIAGNIRHIKPAPRALSGDGALLLGQPLYWSGWLASALAVGGLWLWQNRRQRLLGDTAYARSRRARQKARQILAESQLPSADSDAIVQRALTGYLSDKLNQPVTGLTAARFINLLREAQLSPALVERVHAILQQTDVGRFAPPAGGQISSQSLLMETQNLIDELERAFGERTFGK